MCNHARNRAEVKLRYRNLLTLTCLRACGVCIASVASAAVALCGSSARALHAVRVARYNKHKLITYIHHSVKMKTMRKKAIVLNGRIVFKFV